MELEELGSLLPRFEGNAASGAPLVSVGYFEGGVPSSSLNASVGAASLRPFISTGGAVAGISQPLAGRKR